jgi:arylsulfatase A-like enzyme
MKNFGMLTLALFLGASVTARAEPSRKKPNVLLICADDLAAYTCGAYGNKVVRTPNLDRLAAGGMRFDRAYCNSPVCTPSRQSFLTGRYPRTIGVTQLRTALPESEDTLAEMLKRAGYHTAAIGKMHFNSNLRHGFDLRPDLPEHRARLLKVGKKPLPADVSVQPPWRPFKDPARVWLNSHYLPYGAIDQDMAGSWFAREAVKFLEEKKNDPFFLIVSFTEPHSPFHFPVEFRGRHEPAKMVVPKVGPEDDWQIPAIFRNLTEREKQGIIAAYLTSVEFLDRNVGVVLDALDRLGLTEDTLVIFLGDHGYCLGHHGRFEKHCLFEIAIRAPLFMRLPGRIPARQSTTALVEFIDLVPTVLSFCEQPAPKYVQGKSLLPLLTGKAKTHREKVFVEYAENEEAMVRTDRWAFIYGTGKRARQDGYETGRPLPGRTVLLFDTDSDPDQLKNLAKQPEQAQRIRQFTQDLADHLVRTARQPELIPRDVDVHGVLEHCLQPRDVPTAAKKK